MKTIHKATILHKGWEMDNEVWVTEDETGKRKLMSTSHGHECEMDGDSINIAIKDTNDSLLQLIKARDLMKQPAPEGLISPTPVDVRNYSVVLTYTDGSTKLAKHHSEHQIYGNKSAKLGRPVRIDTYGDLPTPEFIYKTCIPTLHPSHHREVHIHIGQDAPVGN